MAHSLVEKNNNDFINIAHNDIQKRRSTTAIPVAPFGYLHDYVPFYFAPRSPMLYAIKQGNVSGYEGRQDDIVYLVTRTDVIDQANLPFVFTDGHAIMFYTEFFNNLNDLNMVDWEVMESKYWFDTEGDPDRKRRRQAEFLVHQYIGVELFLGLGVRNARMKQVVEDILNQYEVSLPVYERPLFYF